MVDPMAEHSVDLMEFPWVGSLAAGKDDQKAAKLAAQRVSMKVVLRAVG
jgi:RNase P/RNase MRP subunit p30